MRKSLIIFTLLFSTSLFAQNGEKNFIDQNFIEVNGRAEMEIVPDEIYIKITINEKDIKGKTLLDVEKNMFDKLKELGFDLTKDLSIKDLISNFQYYWFIKSDIILSKEYQLCVHDAKSAGKVFIELQKIGISNTSIDHVENSNIIQYRREVKIAAIKAAQEKAKAMVIAINQDIGRALYIQELENANQLQGKMMGINIRGFSNTAIYGSRAAEPEIEFEKIKLEYDILVRFELK